MNKRREGDYVGELDEDGIAQFYPNCKVRKEGDYYFATPHTTNKARRRKRKHEVITVSETDGKLKLEHTPSAAVKNLIEITEDDPLYYECPFEDEQVAVEEVIKESDKKVAEPVTVRQTTRKDLFDELYAKHDNLNPYLQKQAIFKDMLPLFKNEEAAELFVDENWLRRKRNNYVKKQRFKYKAENQEYQYFVTFTYDSKKHSTEEHFVKCLKDTFSNYHKRKGWLIQGIWERGDESNRLHFHGFIYDPNNKIAEDLEEVTEYNPKTGRMKTYKQHKYFYERFGRNEFSEIIPQIYDSAIDYITKYISKHGVNPYYSRGLYSFFRCDIQGKDVLAKMSETDERDIRLIVHKDFTCWDEGVNVGTVSPETIAQLPKTS